MPDLHIVDSTWLGVPPRVLADRVARPALWRRWWPQLRLEPSELRGERGVRWSVTRAPHRGVGSAELWLQADLDGTIAHWILRLDYPSATRPSPRALGALELDYRSATKRAMWALADELDPSRAVRFTSAPTSTAHAAEPGSRDPSR